MGALDGSRTFLKADVWEEWETLETDQRKQIPHPVLQILTPKMRH